MNNIYIRTTSAQLPKCGSTLYSCHGKSDIYTVHASAVKAVHSQMPTEVNFTSLRWTFAALRCRDLAGSSLAKSFYCKVNFLHYTRAYPQVQEALLRSLEVWSPSPKSDQSTLLCYVYLYTNRRTYWFTFHFFPFCLCFCTLFFSFCLLGACENSLWLKVPQSKYDPWSLIPQGILCYYLKRVKPQWLYPCQTTSPFVQFRRRLMPFVSSLACYPLLAAPSHYITSLRQKVARG